jgi:hypothetical protein
MAKEFLSNMDESEVPAAPLVNPERKPVKIMVVGSRWAVQFNMSTVGGNLHSENYGGWLPLGGAADYPHAASAGVEMLSMAVCIITILKH